MEGVQIISYFLTNGIRIFLCLCLSAALLKFPRLKFVKLNKSIALFSLGVAAVITVLSCLSLPLFYLLGFEIVLLLPAARYLFQCDTRPCLFVLFFYEVATALWEFLISAGLGILLRSNRFMEGGTKESMLAVWIVRLLMIGIAAMLYKKSNMSGNEIFRFASIAAVLGMLGVIVLSEQAFLSLEDGSLTTWLILSPILMIAVMFFNMNSQYKTEQEIARLNEEQAKLLERDYQTLNTSYSMNAKVFHDLHNHIGILHRFLIQGKTTDALHYLDDFYMPMQELIQTVWTGDEAVDYLINSKMELAKRQGIQTKLNIEFPSHTNIRSADLTAIIGNLLENALEATGNAEGKPHFIHLTIRRINHMLLIKVENDCKEALPDSNGELRTTKADGGLHGWGLKSARTAAERYDGTLEITCTNNLFCAVAALSYKYSQTGIS